MKKRETILSGKKILEPLDALYAEIIVYEV